MILLSLDPGETLGYAALEATEPYKPPYLLRSGLLIVPCTTSGEVYWVQFARTLVFVLEATRPDRVLIEDYRIYAREAKVHIGQRLFTAELIGGIQLLCNLQTPTPLVARLPAAKKDRWPEARLDVKFPEHRAVMRPHAHDALRLALAYLEKEGIWNAVGRLEDCRGGE